MMQVRALSKLQAEGIEEAVQVPEPLQNGSGGIVSPAGWLFMKFAV